MPTLRIETPGTVLTTGGGAPYRPGLVTSLHALYQQHGYRVVLVTASPTEEVLGLAELLRGEGIPVELAGPGDTSPEDVWVVADPPHTLPEDSSAKQNVWSVAHLGWPELVQRLALPPRQAEVRRKTNETDIHLELNLDGSGIADLHSGLGFLDHMLEQLVRHAGLDLRLHVQGDLHVDEHHTVEDTALALGQAFKTALGDKAGLTRYGFVLPMDEARATVALDFSGRPWLVWAADFHRERIGDVPTELFKHFFHSLAQTAGLTLHIEALAENEHHKIEAIFKGVARALRQALRRERHGQVPSTKGTLEG